MKNISKLVVMAAAVAFATSAMAEVQLKVSTGGPAGTYHRMFTEFQGVCKDEIMMIEVPSSGSVENLDKMVENVVNGAFVQTDTLFYRARTGDLSKIKTLFSLYNEEVHVVAPSVSPIKAGGYGFGIGAEPIQINTVVDLNGQKVAAWGGSTISAQVIRLESEIGFKVVEVDNFAQAKALADSGEVAAIIMVGGQPMGDVKKLDRSYKLLNFPEAIVSKLKGVYVPARLNYSNMGQGGTGITTIATEALFVTRAYTTDKYVNALAALRNCFIANLPLLQEETGFHTKWSSVNPSNKGKWPYYDLPGGRVMPPAPEARSVEQVEEAPAE